jgi:hypothetical protein
MHAATQLLCKGMREKCSRSSALDKTAVASVWELIFMPIITVAESILLQESVTRYLAA